MPCYHPIPGWYGRNRTANGLRPVVFSAAEAFRDRPIEVPCGHCIGCQLERSRQWALRCMHEAQLHQHNVFATLTYDDAHLPPGGSLRPEYFVLFMKRLRKRQGPGVRFFQCGEYGERLSRPHHHALLFNCLFDDQRKLAGHDGRLSRSDTLDDLWQHGHVTLGNVTFEAAAYVARYSLKKVTGPAAAAHYAGRVPEYLTMSRRPGIGSAWLTKYRNDVYPHDFLYLRGGIKSRPPRYYDDQLPNSLRQRLKARRRRLQRDNPDNSGKRLIVREAVATARANLYAQRNYES